MRVTYRELGPAEFRAAIRPLVAVYAAAMNPPDRTLSGREAIMERHAASPGFRGLTALVGGRLAGFTYVLPLWQGRGIGRSLLLSLASDRPERTAVLSTADAQTRARRLYRGVGFTDLLTGFRFSGMEPPYAVMGARLPLCPPGDDEPDDSVRLPRPSNS